MPERPVATSQQDNLHPLCRLAQDLNHKVEPGIVGIDERIIKDQRHRAPLIEQHVSKGDPRQNRQLLLGAA
jgi:hypothetical protein